MARYAGDVVYAPKELPRANPVDTPEQAAQVATDSGQAKAYVQEFYTRAQLVHDATGKCCHRAINKFSEVTKMKEEVSLGPALVYNLIRVALGVLPATAAAAEVFKSLSSTLALAKHADLLKTASATVAQRGAAFGFVAYTMPPNNNSTHAKSVAALDQLGIWDTNGTAEITRQRDAALELVDEFIKTSRCRGNLERMFRQALGSWCGYDKATFQMFEKAFELKVYKEFYGKTALVRITIGSEKVEGVPWGVRLRLKELTQMPTDRSALTAAGFNPGVYIEHRLTRPY
jgi:hypothetical protein